jgi:hypothetical protein
MQKNRIRNIVIKINCKLWSVNLQYDKRKYTGKVDTKLENDSTVQTAWIWVYAIHNSDN